MGNESCGLHLCGQCGIVTLIFGIVFLLDGLKYIAIDPWVLVGVFLGLLGLMSFMKK